MQENANVLEQLKVLLSQKRSKQWYAEKLGITLAEVEDLLKEIKGDILQNDVSQSFIKYNVDNGKIEVNAYYPVPPNEEMVIKDHNIDTKIYKLSAFWTKGKDKGWLVSAFFTKKNVENEILGEQFLEFLKTYEPSCKTRVEKIKNLNHNNTCLLFNKQDAHYNKFDISGNNNIQDRFDASYNAIEKVCKKASVTSNVEQIIYVIGSDQFNSEHTGMTTHGTPQQNILTYQEGFEEICNHEVNIINLLLKYSYKVKVIYLPGNHDRNVGWHMINWLNAYFRTNADVEIDTSMSFTKYEKYSDTAIMLNHGYKVKPEQLAQNFPVEFKKEWSNCNHYYIFTGDLHTELSKDIGAIKFFRLPQMSKASSTWDSEMGYTTSKAQLTAFLIEEKEGITDTYRQPL